MSHARLGEYLIKANCLGEREIDFAAALQAAAYRGERIGAILVEQGFISPESLARSLAAQSGWEFFGGEYVPDMPAIEAAGLSFFKAHSVFPLRNENGHVFLFPDGFNTQATDLLFSVFGRDIRCLIGVEADIRQAISRVDGKMAASSAMGHVSDIKELLNEASVLGATDIHIEPAERSVNVRFRIDGVLHFHQAYPRSDLPRLVNMLFSRCGISAGDSLRFHDARFEEDCHGRKIDIRLSHLPSANGSSLVLRLLDKSRTASPLSVLGYSPGVLARLVNVVKRPHGLILFTGPTGCGKTTSLYSLLGEMKGLGVKVVTAEDPVEVRLPLVTQVSVDLRREQDFHHITRALLRHDPDIILIGEIRDEKTAREAMRASVTGHRVLATLHATDVMGAILRLNDLGIDHVQISHALTCVVAQRLVRKLCPECKILISDVEGYIASSQGCWRCMGGYQGRTVAAEVLQINDDLRGLIGQGRLSDVHVEYQRGPDRQSMREDGERLVKGGIVSREEIERVFG